MSNHVNIDIIELTFSRYVIYQRLCILVLFRSPCKEINTKLRKHLLSGRLRANFYSGSLLLVVNYAVGVCSFLLALSHQYAFQLRQLLKSIQADSAE